MFADAVDFEQYAELFAQGRPIQPHLLRSLLAVAYLSQGILAYSYIAKTLLRVYTLPLRCISATVSACEKYGIVSVLMYKYLSKISVFSCLLW